MSKIKYISLLLITLIICSITVHAKTEKFGTWIELEFRKDITKKLNFSISPEFRLQDRFNLDEYFVQGEISYDLLKFLSVSGIYRIGTEVKKKGNLNYNKLAFDMQASHDIDRFEVSLRGRYTNYSDSEEDEPGKYIRPRLKVEYDIKGNKIRPFTRVEFFHNLTTEKWHKTRYDIGFTRKLGKPHRIGLYYRLHNYFTDKESIHIVGIDYRLKF